MTGPVSFRAIEASEAAAFRRAFGAVFAFDPSDESVEAFTDWAELDRTIAGFDGDVLVTTAGTLSLRLVVPGGAAIAAGGLSMVSVAPTHRRQGLLRQIMNLHFDDAVARSEVVSILYASEVPIYGRFGYGLAIDRLDFSIDIGRATLRADVAAPSGSYRLVSPDEARRLVPPLYEQSVATTAGAALRREADWSRYFYDPEAWRDGATSYRHLIYERDGAIVGAAKYRQKSAWNYEGPDHTTVVNEIVARDGEAYAAVWRFLLSLDLTTRLEAERRPVDDPLTEILADTRRLKRTTTDSIWLRILDVPAALSARRYRMPISMVLDIEDEFRPGAGGRFRLEGGPDGAQCALTDDEPDVRLSTQALSSAYLGAPRLATLAWLDRIHGEPDAIRLLDDAFTTARHPYCQLPF